MSQWGSLREMLEDLRTRRTCEVCWGCGDVFSVPLRNFVTCPHCGGHGYTRAKPPTPPQTEESEE